jgi:hypothetical protein
MLSMNPKPKCPFCRVPIDPNKMNPLFIGGGSNYKEKYLKYKNKYLQLKSQL